MELLAERKEGTRPEDQTGEEINKKHPQVGAEFVICQGGIVFKGDLNSADVVELLWAMDVEHCTADPLFSHQEKKILTLLQGAITKEKNKCRKDQETSGRNNPVKDIDHVPAYACSTQISTNVVAAMKEVMGKRRDMDDEWSIFHPTIAEDY
jgi:hypothetical protein